MAQGISKRFKEDFAILADKVKSGDVLNVTAITIEQLYDYLDYSYKLFTLLPEADIKLDKIVKSKTMLGRILEMMCQKNNPSKTDGGVK
jgi:hypothetical protein